MQSYQVGVLAGPATATAPPAAMAGPPVAFAARPAVIAAPPVATAAPPTAATAPPAAAAIPTVVVTLVILSVILVKRVRGQQLRPRKLITTPLLPMILGVGEAIPLFADPQLGPVHLHGIDYVVLVVDVALSIAIGLARGFTVRIYPKNGTTWYRYGPVTVLLWVLSIVLRIVLGVFGSRHGATTLVTSDSVLVMLGLTLLIQNVTVHTRCRAVARDRVRR